MQVSINSSSGCETIHHRLNCGANIYIIPKNREVSVGAVVVNYGSADTEFSYKGKKYSFPLGTAHFAEHQMFEQPYGNVSEDYKNLGAEVNAFTDAGKTVYYFSTANDFGRCFSTLLEFVETPYFKGKSIENEKSIIKSEIDMYNDDPVWKTFFGALKQLWPDSAFSEEIAGSVKSISDIDADTLYLLHEAFYLPENMTIICAGDIKADDIMLEAEKILSGADRISPEIRKLSQKPKGGYSEITMDIDVPRYTVIYPFFTECTGKDRFRQILMLRIAGDMFFGAGSELFEKLSDDGVIDSAPSTEVYEHNGTGYFAISGSTSNAEKTVESIKQTMENLFRGKADKKDFERYLKKFKGQFISSLDDSMTAVTIQAEYNDILLSEIADCLDSLCYNSFINSLKTIENCVGVCVAGR